MSPPSRRSEQDADRGREMRREQRGRSIPSLAGSAPIRVMCVDDNVLLLQALRRRLTLEPDFEWIAPVSDVDEVMDRVHAEKPAIVLLDIDLPGGADALALLGALAREAPSTHVVVFTGYPSESLIDDAMSRGAWGFIAKGVEPGRFLSALRRVAADEAVLELDGD